MSVLDLLSMSEEFVNICEDCHKRGAKRNIIGLSGTPKAFHIAGCFNQVKKHVILIAASQSACDKLVNDLNAFLGQDKVLSFPALDVMTYGDAGVGHDVAEMRTKAIHSLMTGRPALIVAPASALMDRIVPRREAFNRHLRFEVDDEKKLSDLTANLAVMGYERYFKVETKGQISLKGDILDIFPLDSDCPVRIEFFGDKIESIRRYDLLTQRSIENLNSISISPARELTYTSEEAKFAASKVMEELNEIKKISDRPLKHLIERSNQAAESMEEGIYFDYDQQYVSYFFNERVSILDYLDEDGICIIDEPKRVFEALEGRESRLREEYASLLETYMILPSQADSYISQDEVEARLKHVPSLSFSLLGKSMSDDSLNKSLFISVKSVDTYQGNIEKLSKDMALYKKKGYRVLCAMTSEERVKRLEDGIEKMDVIEVNRWNEEYVQPEGSFGIITCAIESGFIYNALRLVIISETEILGVSKKKSRKLSFSDDSLKISSYMDLADGDFVVHVNHGIGKYEGLKTMIVAGVSRDYIEIKFAGEDKMFVPTDQVELLQKYLGAEDKEPKLSKLSGGEWTKAKSKVKASIQDMAKGLLELYAARESALGHSFGKDTVWQKEFEDSFPYEETPDQFRAIEEIKADMERARPMDRLLCGDVGFGKTEVAMRAAFKAAADGKQVAMLAPTTILVQQHYSTFSNRFEGFPINVAKVSRFESPLEIKQILNDVKKGQIDILIGTHRILSKDVGFKNLGLLIIDEEQRFGVAQKEFIKKLRKEIDVLTLSATPIPRTLHMAMVTVRDMSLIQTPPENRFPIRTHVVEQDDVLLKDVIMKEIDRKGQIYFVHNRVHDIESVAFKLSSLIPEARIAVAHGQMSEAKLEKTMLNFLNKEYDVLVCTTIIESGIDIPNVNTIIVSDASNLGLAQLYQLRGRVGRTNRVAYAYLVYEKDKAITDSAEKRLAAIREFVNLGSGYKIALRDMEIRGVGNILGAEQHGQVATVGFEMYCRLLRETVDEMRGEARPAELPQVTIDLPIDAFLPASYVKDAGEKIEVYRKVNSIESAEDAEDLTRELSDRFGDPPEEVVNLISIVTLKNLARDLGFSGIVKDKDIVLMKFASDVSYSAESLACANRVVLGRGQVFVGAAGKIMGLKLKIDGLNKADMLNKIHDMLNGLKSEAIKR